MSLNLEEEQLLRLLYRFSDVVEMAGEQYSPNVVCTYLFELAQKFNFFYQKHKILNPVTASTSASLSVNSGAAVSDNLSDGAGIASSSGVHRTPRNDDVQVFRLFLTEATGAVLKEGLYLLGIKAPVRM